MPRVAVTDIHALRARSAVLSRADLAHALHLTRQQIARLTADPLCPGPVKATGRRQGFLPADFADYLEKRNAIIAGRSLAQLARAHHVTPKVMRTWLEDPNCPRPLGQRHGADVFDVAAMAAYVHASHGGLPLSETFTRGNSHKRPVVRRKRSRRQ